MVQTPLFAMVFLPFFLYTLQASLTLALLFALYWLVLRRTTFHRLNRFILIGLALLMLLLPVISGFAPIASGLAFARSTPAGALLQRLGNGATASQLILPEAPLPEAPAASAAPSSTAPVQPQPGFTLTPGGMIGLLYCLGLLFFLYRVIAPIVSLCRLIRHNPTERHQEYTLVHLAQPTPPFSFFHWIFLHPGDYPEGQRRHILLHEQVHVRQYHTLDILFMELFTTLFWFHPLAWRLNTLVKLNLEYIADRQLLRAGVTPKEYQYHLLQVSLTSSLTRTANYFNHSHLKKRIAMMNITASRNTVLWKYLFFLPAVFLLILVFGSLQAQDGKATSDIYLVIRPELTEARLHSIEADLLTDGIGLSFSNLSFTPGHQLSGLRMVITQGAQTLEDITIAGSGQPLAEPLIFYWFRSRQGSLGLSRGYPSGLAEKDLNIMRKLSGLLKLVPGTQQFELHGSAQIGN